MLKTNSFNDLKKYLLPIVFSLVFLLSLSFSEQTPYDILYPISQDFISLSIICLAMILPIRAGMGFNFGIIAGVYIGNFSIILAMMLGFSGNIATLMVAILVILFALLSGGASGFLLHKANKHAMLSSYFFGILNREIYRYIFIFAVGGVLTYSNQTLLNPTGKGIKNVLPTKEILFTHNAYQVPLFLFLLCATIVYIMYYLYQHLIKAKSDHKDPSFIIACSIILLSASIMYFDFIPSSFQELRTIEIPLIASLLLLSLAIVLHKISGLEYQITPAIRVGSVVISTFIAAWAQIIHTQQQGYLITFSEGMHSSFFIVFALVIGGATYKVIRIKHCFLGALLALGFIRITLPIFSRLPNGNLSGILSSLMISGVILYSLTNPMLLKSKRTGKSAIKKALR